MLTSSAKKEDGLFTRFNVILAISAGLGLLVPLGAWGQSADTIDPAVLRTAEERMAARQAERERATTQASTEPVVVKPRISADGVPYPAVKGDWYLKSRFPLVQDWIGKPPEEITNGKIYSIDCAQSLIANLRSRMAQDNVPMSDFSWVIPGLGGSICALASLKDGRASAFCFYFGNAAPTTVAGLLPGFKEASQIELTFVSNGFLLDANYNLQLAVSGPASKTRAPFRPAWIYIRNDNIGWYIGTHQLKPEIASAIRSGKVLNGMTRDDVSEALRQALPSDLLSADGSGSLRRDIQPSNDHPAPMAMEVDFAHGVVVSVTEKQE